MAKGHVLPRYLLRAAVCVCVLFGFGVLGRFYAERAKTLRLTAKDAEVMSVVGPGSVHSVVDPLGVFAEDSLHTLREPALRDVYLAEIGVKEATGKNDGSQVGEYLRYCGLSEGYAWCAAFVSWCHGQAGYPKPRNAWAAALFPSSRTIWRTGDGWPVNGGQPIPRAGDVFGIYYSNLNRIAHAGFVDGWDGKYCITVEGNTGPDGTVDTRSDPANPIRAGPIDGVYRKQRPIRTIHAVARWAE